MYSLPPRPRRRGCLRGCAGCLFHHPITLLASFFAVVLWLPHLVHVTLYIAAGTEPDPWPLVWTTLLLLAAQLVPRITPMLYRAGRAHVALVRDRQLQHAHVPIDPAPLRVSAGGAAAAQAVSGATPPWREYRDRLWTATANPATYYGSANDGDFGTLVAGNTCIRLTPGQESPPGSLLEAQYQQSLSLSDIAAIRPGEPGPYIRLYDSSPSEEHTDE